MEPWMIRDTEDSEPRAMTVAEMKAEIGRLERLNRAARIELEKTQRAIYEHNIWQRSARS